MPKNNNIGVTLVEILVAAVISVITIGILVSMWRFTYLNWKDATVSYELEVQLQTALERLKREIKISSGNMMHFHLDGTKITAISFPVALDDGNPATTGGQTNASGDGFIELDDGGTTDLDDDSIFWDAQAVYFVNSHDELTKGLFNPRSQTLSVADRNAQLAECANETYGGDYNWANYAEQTIAEKVSDFEITKKPITFDGYAAALQRSNEIDFGSIPLTSGYHTLTFRATGQNILSGGYEMGIDLFKIDPCGYPREGEDYINLTHLSGAPGIASATKTYAKEIMTAGGSWRPRRTWRGISRRPGPLRCVPGWFTCPRNRALTRSSVRCAGTGRTTWLKSPAGCPPPGARPPPGSTRSLICLFSCTWCGERQCRDGCRRTRYWRRSPRPIRNNAARPSGKPVLPGSPCPCRRARPLLPPGWTAGSMNGPRKTPRT